MMAKFRYAVLENDVAKTATLDSGTETIDLPEKGILSEVDFMARVTPSYTDDTPIPPWVVIKKLELLVDGSTVVKSLDGRQCKALIWYNQGPFDKAGWYHTAHSHNVYYHHFPLYLGRFCGDTKYGLDLEAYSNPQLKVEWDGSQTSDHGATYDVNTSPAFTYNCQAKVFDGRPIGFLNKYIQSRQIDSWTVAASTEHSTEIPRGFPLRGLMVEAAYKSVDWFSLIEHLKLDFDNGKWLPIDMDYENLKATFLSWFPRECAINQAVYNANGDDFDFQVMEINSMLDGSVSLSNAAFGTGQTSYGLGTINVSTEAGAAQTSGSMSWCRVAGWGPMGTIYIPMKELLDGIVEAIETTQYGRIDLKTETGSASGTSATTKVVAEYDKPNTR